MPPIVERPTAPRFTPVSEGTPETSVVPPVADRGYARRRVHGKPAPGMTCAMARAGLEGRLSLATRTSRGPASLGSRDSLSVRRA